MNLIYSNNLANYGGKTSGGNNSLGLISNLYYIIFSRPS